MNENQKTIDSLLFLGDELTGTVDEILALRTKAAGPRSVHSPHGNGIPAEPAS
jgi:hypothetical protein